jgi:hypothetical protein
MNFFTATPLWAVMIVDNDYPEESNAVEEGFDPPDRCCGLQIFSARHLADAWANSELEDDQEESKRAIVCQLTPSHIMQWQTLVTTESCEPAVQPLVPRTKQTKGRTPAPEQPRGRRLDLSE